MPGTLGAVNSAHFDGNQVPSMMGVAGSAGTADVKGTALPLPIGVREDTGAMYVYNLGPAGAVTVAGTDPTSYLPARLTDGTTFYNASGGGGTVAVSAGTIIGTYQTLTGTTAVGTTDVVAATNVSGYKWLSVQADNNFSGTFQVQVSNDNVTFFTIPVYSSTQVGIGGNLNSAANSLIYAPLSSSYFKVRMLAFSSGTATITAYLTTIPAAPSSLDVRAATGTITAGTLTNLVSGTINALAAGTLSPLPTIANTTFGTIGTTGVTIFGTIAGGTSSGAGTEIFVTSVSLTIPATAGSQDVSIGFGTNAGTFHAGTARLVRGMFPAGGGIQKSFWPPINSGTNAQLTYFQAGAGTVEVDVTYFVTPSTL